MGRSLIVGLKLPKKKSNSKFWKEHDRRKERGYLMTLSSLKPRLSNINTRIGAPIIKRIRGRKLHRIRDRILYRDNYTCCRCGRVTIDLQVDHITPLSVGGAESDENRQSLCVECHDKKTEREIK